MDWHSAQRRCQQDGAYLAIADTNQKIHFLKRKLSYDAWIGLNKNGGRWKWIDGTDLFPVHVHVFFFYKRLDFQSQPECS